MAVCWSFASTGAKLKNSQVRTGTPKFSKKQEGNLKEKLPGRESKELAQELMEIKIVTQSW